MKYGIITIEVRHGEYEFNTPCLYIFEDTEKIEDIAEEYARTYYSQEEYIEESGDFIDKGGEKYPGFDEDCWFFNGGELRSKVYNAEQITKEEYDIMSKYI